MTQRKMSDQYLELRTDYEQQVVSVCNGFTLAIQAAHIERDEALMDLDAEFTQGISDLDTKGLLYKPAHAEDAAQFIKMLESQIESDGNVFDKPIVGLLGEPLFNHEDKTVTIGTLAIIPTKREMYVRIINGSGEQIDEGEIVHIVDFKGGFPVVGLVQDIPASFVLVAAEDINTEGYCSVNICVPLGYKGLKDGR